MPKTKISEFDSTPANNTDIDSINIAEGCAPSGINNAIRELMSQLKDQQTGASGDNFTVGGNLVVNGTASGPTASAGTNTNQFATTAFVQSVAGSLGTISSQNANNVTITGGSINGITGTATGFTAGTSRQITNSGGWNVTPNGTKLFFNYNGTNVASLDSSGNLIVLANITAFGTP
jgi:hypothetical protein